MTTNYQEVLDGAGDGPLTPEQAAALIGAMEQGDTNAQALDDGGAPEPTTAQGNEPQEQEAAILARDGKHTIPYQKLADARNDAQIWKAQAEASQAELESLREQAQARADAGEAPTKTDNMVAAADAAIDAGADISLFGDFSEEAMADGILKMVRAEVATALKPMHQKQEQERATEVEQAIASHANAILAAHPDAASIYQSEEMERWITSRPFYAQGGIREALSEGTTDEVIAIFSDYKKDSGIAPSRGGNKAVATRAAAAAAAAYAPPASLSEIPGGRAGAYSVADQLSGLSGAELVQAMDGLSDDAIEAFLNRA